MTRNIPAPLLLRRAVLTITVLFVACSRAAAAFQTVAQYDAGFNWIARGDSGWYFGGSTSLILTDEQFVYLSELPLSAAASDMRGLDWDPSRGVFVVSHPDARIIASYRTDGTLDSQFASTDFVNDIAVNTITGDLWLASFSGRVERVSAAGAVLGSFFAPWTLTGVAVDPVRNTLYLMRADGPGGVDGPLDDEIYEFSYLGANLGLQAPAAAFSGTNALALDYIAETGRLYASGQLGARVTVLERVPEPASAVLALAAAALVGRRWP